MSIGLVGQQENKYIKKMKKQGGGDTMTMTYDIDTQAKKETNRLRLTGKDSMDSPQMPLDQNPLYNPSAYAR